MMLKDEFGIVTLVRELEELKEELKEKEHEAVRRVVSKMPEEQKLLLVSYLFGMLGGLYSGKDLLEEFAQDLMEQEEENVTA